MSLKCLMPMAINFISKQGKVNGEAREGVLGRLLIFLTTRQ
ncbi:hypothetical protein SPONN_2708 [uncultured Candidatus Thioglobus sp.]|nr:hypothetical protein SPONN_2708 [uncultured Candidatus Thioglobus sp.]